MAKTDNKDERIAQLEGLLEGCTKWANAASSFLKGKDELKNKVKELEVCASHLSTIMLLATKDEVWDYLLAWHTDMVDALAES